MNIAAIAAAFGGVPPVNIFAAPDRFWISKKMRPTQFASRKNTPGTDYAKKELPWPVDQFGNCINCGGGPEGSILHMEECKYHGVPPTAE